MVRVPAGLQFVFLSVSAVSSACATTTIVAQADAPVSSIVGSPPTLPKVPAPPPAPPPPPPPPPSPPKVVINSHMIQLVEAIQFVDKTSELSVKSLPVLEELTELLEKNPHLRQLSIEVHTDTTGSNSKNKRLAQSQADAIVNKLLGAGIEQERLTTKAWGESNPLVRQNTDEADLINRRVEIFIVNQVPPLEKHPPSQSPLNQIPRSETPTPKIPPKTKPKNK